MRPLPIDSHLAEVVRAVASARAAVVVAAPGAGKSTRVPPALLRAGILDPAHPRLILLQPRRVAAITLARRIASEQGWRTGSEIGWSIRHDTVGGSDTRLWVQTEGTLTRRLEDDPFLEGVGAVVIDEFHERSRHADLALAWLSGLRALGRPDLVVVVMSATLDPAPVAAFLGGVPVLEVGGTHHPVTLVYRPAQDRERLVEQTVRVAEEALTAEAGDCLAFLPGVGEITAAARLLEERGHQVFPLHGQLSPEEQERALTPSGRQRIILATNVAETSLTVEGIASVVDSGWARVDRHDPDTGLDQLRLERISLANAAQRAGRAGRTRPGRCYRCWSKLEEGRLAAALEPEIDRTDLAPLALSLKRIHGPDLRSFRFFTPPAEERLAAAEDLLVLLGLTSGPWQPLNGRGRLVAGLGTHPRLGRLMLEAAAHQAVELGIRLAALLEERDLRPPWRPGDPEAAPGTADLIDRLDRLSTASAEAGTLRRIHLALGQFRQRLRELGGGDGRERQTELLPRLLLAAYPDRVARRPAPDANRATVMGGTSITINPGSCLYARPGRPRLPLLVAHAVQGLAGRGRQSAVLTLGAEIDEALLAELAGTAFVTESRLDYEPDRDRVLLRRTVRYRDLVLRHHQETARGPEASACLAAALAPGLEELLAGHPAAATLLARWRWLNRVRPDLGLPPLDLAAGIAALCAGCSSRAEVLRQDPAVWLQGLIGAHLATLDRLAPERLSVPSGSRIRLDWSGPRPVLAVRLQELYGCATTPRLADREPVLLHLLGPNHRPVQITDDLGGFWQRTYPQVRKDLRGRYPRHSWPEDPLTAEPEAKGGRKND